VRGSSRGWSRARAATAQDVNGVLLLGVGGDVLEDVHRLERFSKGSAFLAERVVLAHTDARHVLVPEFGEEITTGAGDVVAVSLYSSRLWIRMPCG